MRLQDSLVVRDEGLEFTQAGVDDAGFAAVAVNGFLGFEPVAGDAEDDTLVAGNFSAFDELAGAGDSGTALPE